MHQIAKLNDSSLVLQLSLPNPQKAGVKSSRCKSMYLDGRCSNYIWVINEFIAY